MFLSSFIEELCTKEENNKADCTLISGGQCTLNSTDANKTLRIAQKFKRKSRM